MNKEQLGRFIADSRKQLNMTQQSLAELLHVTDKAVSKWERGLSYPDVTLLEPLADALQLSVSELMACKRIPDLKESEVAAKSLLDIAKQSQRRSGRKAAFTAVLLSFLAVLLIGVVLLFAFASKEYTVNTTFLTKQHEADGFYVFIETDTGVLRLQCQNESTFDEIKADGKQYYQIIYRWNWLMKCGTLRSCEIDTLTLGTVTDQIGSSIGVDSLLGAQCVWMEYIYIRKDPQHPDSYLNYLGFYYLNDGKEYYTGSKNASKTYLLKVDNCRSVLTRDHDADGVVELFVLTSDNNEPYRIYDLENGKLSLQVKTSVASDIEAELLTRAR